ncbi:MAG: ERF family protein [Candidatus Bathyarchaeia archaeon]
METKETVQLTLSNEILASEKKDDGNNGEKTLDSLRQMLFALKDAKAEFLGIKRNATNYYLGNSYATLGKVLEAVEPALTKHDFIIEHRLVYREGKTYLSTSILHIPTLQNLTTELELSYRAGDMQSLGSAITYARRYSLLVLLGLSMEDDDGNKAKEDGGDKLVQKQATQRLSNNSVGNISGGNNPFQRRP